MIAIIDYGAGNIFSVKNALDYLGAECRLSYEFEECEGLGLIKGYVDRIDEPGLVIPQMGWNKLVYNHDCPLFEGLEESYVYFVHSYKAFCDDKALYAYCEYGSKVSAVVGNGKNVYGTQFFPEKSGAAGLRMLENFAKM